MKTLKTRDLQQIFQTSNLEISIRNFLKSLKLSKNVKSAYGIIVHYKIN